jgi:hypothetical protein
MHALRFPGVAVSVHHPVMIAERGSAVPDWSQPSASIDVIDGCVIAPGAADDADMPRQRQTIRWTLYVPPSPASIGTFDRIGLPGITILYQVVGEPNPWSNPDGGDPYRVIELVDQEGWQ